ncbi:MAG: hypothetical protein HY726_07630 [Candidatus Rokubacteria bacterium]|nr:hypothetical protein [Candidatus Rokubacteria bacterium]
MTTFDRVRVRHYVTSSQHYLENALALLQLGEAAKASEFFWGSVAEAIQAVAVWRGTHLANHRSLRYWAATIAKELNDPTINEGFVIAERLHSNFHEVELDAVDVATVAETIRRTVAKLLAIIPPEALEEASPS